MPMISLLSAHGDQRDAGADAAHADRPGRRASARVRVDQGGRGHLLRAGPAPHRDAVRRAGTPPAAGLGRGHRRGGRRREAPALLRADGGRGRGAGGGDAPAAGDRQGGEPPSAAEGGHGVRSMFRLVIRLYPAAHRAAYEDEIMSTVRDSLESQGRLGVLWELADLTVHALRERTRLTATSAVGAVATAAAPLAAGSAVALSLVFLAFAEWAGGQGGRGFGPFATLGAIPYLVW